VKDALNYTGWHDAMLEEIHALDENHTWYLVDLPNGKKAVACNGSLRSKLIPMALLQDLRPGLWLKAMPRLMV